MARLVAALVLLGLGGCAPFPKYPAPYCGLVCDIRAPMRPTQQRCEWANCAGPVKTVADA